MLAVWLKKSDSLTWKKKQKLNKKGKKEIEEEVDDKKWEGRGRKEKEEEQEEAVASDHRLRLECGLTMVPRRWHQFASSPDMGSGV